MPTIAVELSYNPTLNYGVCGAAGWFDRGAGREDGGAGLDGVGGRCGDVRERDGCGVGAVHRSTYPMAGTDGIVLSAPNGGESPFRGHLDAYDAKTGALLWRAWNTPDPTQTPYILSWSNPAEAATAGAAVWTIPAVDPGLGTVCLRDGESVSGDGSAAGERPLDGEHHGGELEDRARCAGTSRPPITMSSTSTFRTR